MSGLIPKSVFRLVHGCVELRMKEVVDKGLELECLNSSAILTCARVREGEIRILDRIELCGLRDDLDAVLNHIRPKRPRTHALLLIPLNRLDHASKLVIALRGI